MSFVARCFQRGLARRGAIQMVCCHLKILHLEQNPGPSVALLKLSTHRSLCVMASYRVSKNFLFPSCMHGMACWSRRY